MPCDAGKSAGRTAFTLVEMVIVVVIVGVLAAVALPRFTGSLENQKIEAATRRIIADLARAQSQARMSETAQTVQFSTTTNSYTLTGMQDMDHAAKEYTVTLADPPYEVALSAASLGGDQAIVFDGYGTPDSGGTIALKYGGMYRILTVDGDTGRVTTSDSLNPF